ncbi:MAG: sugar ABC transporter substrate-binding protein [Alphaproteobacteria bacterium]|nr:sugar ABC transporter substrate-binding protein [Alphaproteobacteria bacterium]
MHGRLFRFLVTGLFVSGLAACSGFEDAPTAAPQSVGESPGYLVGPGDQLQIFVWRNPELSTSVPVRPDGRISLPLIEDLQAANKTPTELARDVEEVLAEFVQNPVVTIIVTGFVGPFDQQVRVVGEASRPSAIQFREKMTILDVMIAVGGLTEFAAGNRAVIVRADNKKQVSYRVRLDDLLKDGDVTANVDVLPGDVLIIPQSWF